MIAIEAAGAHQQQLPLDEIVRLQQMTIATVEQVFRDAEAAAQRDDCSTWDDNLGFVENAALRIPYYALIPPETREQWKQRAREIRARGCPPGIERQKQPIGKSGTGQQGPAEAEEPTTPTAEAPPSPRQQAVEANYRHAQAAERCDRAEMARRIQELERLAKEAEMDMHRWDGLYTQGLWQEKSREYHEILKILQAARERHARPCPRHRRQPRIQRPQQPQQQPTRPQEQEQQPQQQPTRPQEQEQQQQQQQQQRTQGAFDLDRTAQQLLALHNRTRAEVGVLPLQWNPQLAAQAAAYGPQLAQYGRPVHASRKGRETSRENLLQALPGTSPEKMVGVWIAERQHFVPGTFPNVSRTGNWADVGHYTQMVWPTTTHVGCAVHRGGQFDWLICRYSPPGNQDGKPVGMPPLPH